MKISKKPIFIDNCLRKIMFYKNARTGFRAFLQATFKGKSGKILLPAYIGWSTKEGSGVFDPIAELGIDYVFYRMTDRLHIDMDDVARCLKENQITVAVIIHYFGYVDPAYEKFVATAHEAGIVVFEDQAHSMLSDIVGGICGRTSEASAYSLHKLLPVNDGGVLLLNIGNKKILVNPISETENIFPYWEYDLLRIARKRRENTRVLMQMLRKLVGEVEILRPIMDDSIVPQTLPVIIKDVSRDKLYEVMNLRGYGVVSLYHTMIKEIKKEEFPISHELSGKIMNLPVHQDIGIKEIAGMVDCFASGIADLKG